MTQKTIGPTSCALVYINEMRVWTGLGRTTLHRKVREEGSDFPKPFKICGVPGKPGGRLAWRRNEVEAYLRGTPSPSAAAMLDLHARLYDSDVTAD